MICVFEMGNMGTYIFDISNIHISTPSCTQCQGHLNNKTWVCFWSPKWPS